MKLLLELSKENLELSIIEALTIAKPKTHTLKDNLLKLNTKKDLTRLAQTKKIYQISGKEKKLIHQTSFKDRFPKLRPEKHPATMQPKLARTLVNLTGLKKGQTLLDPFCGIGSILIEAALLKIKPIGIDIKEDMLKKAKTNLKHFNLKATLKLEDATKTKIRPDAIATDPPYGKSTVIQKDLYKNFLKNAYKILKPNSKLVITFPKKIKTTPFKTEKIIPVYINKSLTRYTYILKK